jgi:SAM-dependent methyltransferase
MTVVGTLHGTLVFGRRVRVLSSHIAGLIPSGAEVLDVGCGDGSLARLISHARPDVRIQGIDVLVRPVTHIPVAQFDGENIPFPDQSFDVVMFVDVLHHTTNQRRLLTEARRVARLAIVVKDHCRDGLFAESTLRFMDWVGNAHQGVVLPYAYWPERQWRETFAELGLEPSAWTVRLGLYPWPFSYVFERNLHFIASLTKTSGSAAPAESRGQAR